MTRVCSHPSTDKRHDRPHHTIITAAACSGDIVTSDMTRPDTRANQCLINTSHSLTHSLTHSVLAHRHDGLLALLVMAV